MATTVKKEVRFLSPGDILAGSGAKVISRPTAGIKTPSGKVEIRIEYPNGQIKLQTWGKYTVVSVVVPETPAISNTELLLFKGAYIGMKDQDGALLFEGDRVSFYCKGQFVTCTIVYVPEWAMFCLKWDDGYRNKFPMNPEKYTKVI